MTEARRRRRAAKPAGAIPPRAETPPPMDAVELGYSALIEQASDAIVVTDGDFRVLHANARAREMFGFGADEWPRLNARELPTAGELEEHPLEEERLRRGEPVTTYRRLRRKDGTVFPAETNARGLPDGRIIAIVRDIGPRLEMEQQLAASEARYAAVVEQALDAIVILDTELRIRDANASACRMFGFARDELLGVHISDLVPPGELQREPLGLDRLRREGVAGTRRKMWRKDHTTFAAETSATRLDDGRIVTIVRDITRRLETEQQLAESEARYRAVVERATVGITVTDARWRFVEVNPRACEIFGRSREDLLRLTVREIAAPGELTERPLREPELKAGLDSFATRHVRRPDGSVRVVEISARDLGGGQVVSVVTDVTERVEAERRLAESERQMAKAQELAHFGNWEVNFQTGEVQGSPEVYRLAGVAPGAGPLTYERLLSTVHPEDRAGVERTVRDAMEGRPTPWTYEYRVLHPDGTTRVLHASFAAERDPSGRVTRLVGAAQDITERRLLELQLREAQKLEAIGRLAGGVAHDFNNLLTVILGFSETMLDGMGPDDPQRGATEQIRLAARRAAGLTQQLLAFGRRQVLRPEVFDLNGVLGGMQDILRRLIGETIEVSLAPRAHRAFVRADRGQIEQVVMNLALNARDAMPSGGRLDIGTADAVAPEAPAAGERPAREVVLTVRDTGIGMGPEVMAHIFEPFYTTKDVGQGTGLGLATVHGIVSQTGGRIEVSSTPGGGTTFRIHLPCAEDETLPAEISIPAGEAGGDETVLIVEDDPGVRGLVGDVLRLRGYRVLEARDGEAAVAVVAGHDGPVHLLVTDVVMPGMDGPELVRRLLAVRPGLRALLISGYSGERVDRRDLAGSDVAFLQKPFSPGALALKVRELLDLPEPGPSAGV